MNEKRFYQMAKHEYSKNSWYYALAHFFHQIDLRNAETKASKSNRSPSKSPSPTAFKNLEETPIKK